MFFKADLDDDDDEVSDVRKSRSLPEIYVRLKLHRHHCALLFLLVVVLPEEEGGPTKALEQTRYRKLVSPEETQRDRSNGRTKQKK